MVRRTQLDPVFVLNLMACYGHKRTVERLLGLSPRSLDTIMNRPHNWHIAFAVEAGLRIYRINRARSFAQ